MSSASPFQSNIAICFFFLSSTSNSLLSRINIVTLQSHTSQSDAEPPELCKQSEKEQMLSIRVRICRHTCRHRYLTFMWEYLWKISIQRSIRHHSCSGYAYVGAAGVLVRRARYAFYVILRQVQSPQMNDEQQEEEGGGKPMYTNMRPTYYEIYGRPLHAN